MCGLSKNLSQSLYCLHPNSAMSSHMSHWNNQDPTWALKSLLFRAVCPTRSSVTLCSKMNSAQKFYSWWKLYLKCFSTVPSEVSHFACVTKQPWSARSYKSWLHKTTLHLEHPWTKFDPYEHLDSQDTQISSAAKIKAEFGPGNLRLLLILQHSLTRNLSSF